MLQTKFLLLTCSIFLITRVNAQVSTDTVPVNTLRLLKDTSLIKQLEVQSTRLQINQSDYPGDVLVLPVSELLQPQNMADALEKSGRVFVQRSQLGGGSPVLRGMEANRILLVVDGIRLNNAIFRGGHLQNLLRQNPMQTDRIEIIQGPSSSLYGSDALGGVIGIVTKQPLLASDEKKQEQHIDVNLQLSSGNLQQFDQEQALHLSWNAGFKMWAVATSLTLNRFGDLRQGAQNARPEWQNYVFSKRENGVDVAVINEHPEIQTYSGYEQLNVSQKWLFQSKSGNKHTVSFFHTNSGNVARYDRLSELSANGNPAYAEWYYGPEKWSLAAYTLDLAKKTSWYDKGRIAIAWQRNKECRNSRRFNGAKLTSRLEQVDALSINADFSKGLRFGRFFYGMEAYTNDVQSTAFAKDVTTGEQSPASTRYPAGGSTVNNAAAYFNTQIDLLDSDRLIMHLGGRFTLNQLQANFGSQEFYPFPYTEANQQNQVFCAQGGLVFKPLKSLLIRTVASQGFRAANVDDLAKVFDSAPGTLIIPNPDLKPERNATVELGIEWELSDKFSIYADAYVNRLKDIMVTAPFQLASADSVMYDGVLSQVYANQNSAIAQILGAQVSMKWQPDSKTKIAASYTYTEGKVLSDPQHSPLDHIPPIFGRISITRDWSKRFETSFWVLYQGDKPLSLYSPSGEDNLQYATPNGMPAWETLNLSCVWSIRPGIKWSWSIENLLDTNYRVFSSGISAPGRLFRTSLSLSF